MSMQFDFYSRPLGILLRWLGIFVLCFMLLASFAVPASADGNGWIEIHAVVPEGFEEHILVCFVNQDTGDDYAARLMKINDYVSFLEVPAGHYVFDCAFLENKDFRYNTNLVSGSDTFEVSVNDAAVRLDFETTYNEKYSNGAKPTDPPDPTESTTLTPVSTNPASTEQATVPSTENNADQPSGEFNADSTVETASPSETTTAPSDVLIPTEGGDDAVVPGTTVSGKDDSSLSGVPSDEKGSSVSKSDKNTNEDADASKDTEEDEAQGLSVRQKIFFAVIATAVFVLIVFVGAYLYRRHLENS